jgi:hypothetical protein
MGYSPNIPQPTDLLSNSQGDLLTKFKALDTSFGVDHYMFSNATSSNGFHNQVTTPGWVGTPPGPPVTTINPIIFGWQYTVPLGLLQFSEGPTGAVPTPITSKNSPYAHLVVGAGATTNLMDFAGLTFAIANIYAYQQSPLAAGTVTVYWNGAAFLFVGSTSFAGGATIFQGAGSILQIFNNSLLAINLLWSLEFVRLQTVAI